MRFAILAFVALATALPVALPEPQRGFRLPGIGRGGRGGGGLGLGGLVGGLGGGVGSALGGVGGALGGVVSGLLGGTVNGVLGGVLGGVLRDTDMEAIEAMAVEEQARIDNWQKEE